MRQCLFVETTRFTAQVRQTFKRDEDYGDLQAYLLNQPEAGVVIRGTGALRKLRWRDPTRQKSKRGGLRIIYLHVPEVEVFLLLDLYSKDEADDLTTDERKMLRDLAEDFIREAKIRFKR